MPEEKNVEKYVPRLKTHYLDVVRPKLMERFGYISPMQLPRLDKIVLNMGVGEAVGDSKLVTQAAEELGKIAGQRPVITRARDRHLPAARGRSASTLRRDRMFEFLDRYVNIALPRVRDFRGLSPTSFDGKGNYAVGNKEHIVFPEIDYDRTDRTWGFDVIICTTAKTDDEARALLEEFNFPFRKPAARRQAA